MLDLPPEILRAGDDIGKRGQRSEDLGEKQVVNFGRLGFRQGVIVAVPSRQWVHAGEFDESAHEHGHRGDDENQCAEGDEEAGHRHADCTVRGEPLSDPDLSGIRRRFSERPGRSSYPGWTRTW